MNTSNRVRRITAVAIVAAFSAGFAISSHADSGEVAQSTVKFADLSLQSSPGAEALYHRLVAAARGVCEALKGADLASWHRNNACIDQALAKAVAKVGQPALSAVYTANNPHPMSTIRVANR